MARYLKKDEAVIVLYQKLQDDDFYYSINITSKHGGSFYESWLSFKDEIEELCIYPYDDAWLCEDSKYDDRLVLKDELERRGFNVLLGEYYDG